VELELVNVNPVEAATPDAEDDGSVEFLYRDNRREPPHVSFWFPTHLRLKSARFVGRVPEARELPQ